jgi:ADP-heptose:LPS heptosyltransferase
MNKSIDNQNLQLENTTSTISKITNKVIDIVSEFQKLLYSYIYNFFLFFY